MTAPFLRHILTPHPTLHEARDPAVIDYMALPALSTVGLDYCGLGRLFLCLSCWYFASLLGIHLFRRCFCSVSAQPDGQPLSLEEAAKLVDVELTEEAIRILRPTLTELTPTPSADVDSAGAAPRNVAGACV